MADEKNFENRVKRWLESEGIYPANCPADKITAPMCGWYLKMWGGGQFQKSGIPDLLICVNGIFVSCELKGPTGRPSELQKKNTVMINKSGGIGVVLWPDGFDQFKNIVEGVKSCNFHIPALKLLKNANTCSGCDTLTG